jgi:flagellin
MSSILTNVSAMAALQTLRGISNDMETTQGRISSGLRVGTASDNAAYWSIATTMRSDNAALSSVQDAMGLGAAKVDTAYAGMEAAIDVVQEIKNKLVTAAEGSADKGKIQEEITQLQDQLRSIASSSTFSGENWLKADIGGESDADTGLMVAGEAKNKQVVGSFTRDANGNVAVKNITVKLDESNVLFDTSGGKAGILDAEALAGYRNSGEQDTNGNDIYVATVDFGTDWEQVGDVWTVPDSDLSDNTFYVEIGGAFVVSDENGKVDTSTAAAAADVAGAVADGISVVDFDITEVEDYKTTLGLGTDATDEQVIAALTSFVDGQLEKMNSAAAGLGSTSMRLDMQEEFVSKLSDSLDRGVGRLVDADMNEESTRLKALQTQQQLAVQALSIANSDSQNILSLFR